MRKDGELHADEDRQHKEDLETRNEADSAVYRTEKLLKDNHDKLSDANRRKIETAVAAVTAALKGSDVAAIKTASATLNETWQAVSTELYKTASEQTRADHGPGGGQPGPQPETGGAPQDSKTDEPPIIDAEIVDEKKAA